MLVRKNSDFLAILSKINRIKNSIVFDYAVTFYEELKSGIDIDDCNLMLRLLLNNKYSFLFSSRSNCYLKCFLFKYRTVLMLRRIKMKCLS